MSTFKVGEIVQVGEQGEKGKIIEITKPLGTYNMYKVHMMGSGEIKSAAKHELVKGLADEVFHNLFDCFQPLESTSSTSTMSLTELLNNDQTFNTLNEIDIYENRLNEPVSAPKSRFVDLPTSPNAFIQTRENKRTKSKISCHINLLKQFLESKQEPRSPEDIPPAELNKYLMEFLLCVRQQNGSEYEPSTLRNMLSSFDRYLKDHDYSTSIIKGDQFNKTMKAFNSKAKDLKMKGMGNKPKAAAPASDSEINMLYERGQLGDATPASIINTLWLNNTLHFGMRGGGAEHRQLMWGDIAIHYDTDLNTEYLEYNERQTKTRTGVDLNNIRKERPRLYATGTDTCPVGVYKIYASHRPDLFSGPETPFYLAAVTNTRNPAPNQQWFLKQPIGINKLSSLMSTMAKKADLPEVSEGKRLTNTSIRKRLCQKLLTANVPDTQAIHITGHKNSDSLNNYRTLNNHQQRNISNILANTSTGPAPPPQRSNPSTMPTSMTGPAPPPQTFNPSTMPTSMTGPAPPPQTFNPSTMPTSMTGPAPPPQTFNPSIMPTSMTGPAPPPPPQTFNHSTMPTSMSMTEHGKIQQSLVYTQSRHKSHVSKSSGTELVSGLFQNATITGGVFNITILSGKRKREATIDSDEECLVASQDY